MSFKFRTTVVLLLPLATVLSTLAGGVWGEAARAGKTLVMLAPQDQPQAARTLRSAVKAQLSDVKLKLRVQSVPTLPAGPNCHWAKAQELVKQPEVAAVFWFDVGAKRVCLLFSARRGGRLVNRQVAGAGEEGRFEAAALVVRTAVRASPPRPGVGGGQTSGPRGALPSRRLGRPGLAWLALELAYGLDVLAATDVAHGLRVAAQVRLHRRWTVYLGYRWESRVQVYDADEDAELQRYPLDAGVGFRHWFGAFELGARLGLGFAYTRLFQRLPATSSNAVKGTSEWLVYLDARVYVGVRLLPRLLLFFAAGVRIYALNARYQLNGDEVLLAPWPVQPCFQAGLSVDIF